VPNELERMPKRLGPVRRAKFPRNLPVPCRLSDVYGPPTNGEGGYRDGTRHGPDR
jgi:hypothetical protein